MTYKQAVTFFFAVTGIFIAVFVGLTLHSHTRFPALTHADQITDQVLEGKDVWHAQELRELPHAHGRGSVLRAGPDPHHRASGATRT